MHFFIIPVKKQQSILQYTSPLKDCKQTEPVCESPAKRKAKQRTLFESFGSIKSKESYRNGQHNLNHECMSSRTNTGIVCTQTSKGCHGNQTEGHGDDNIEDNDLEEFLNDAYNDWDGIEEPVGKKIKL